jgi:hypothetical protein
MGNPGWRSLDSLKVRLIGDVPVQVMLSAKVIKRYE